MTRASEERLLAQAGVVRARGMATPPDGPPPPEIVDSWARCAQAGLDLALGPRARVIEAAELARRREASAVVRRLALAELETLCHQIAGSNFLLAFADPDGVILDLYADNRFRASGSAADIVVGSCWSESVAGTNGLGTALASGTSVAVDGPEHYFLRFADISCTASPIRDAAGRIVGVLDASSYFESRQRHTQALVRMAATHIENLLLAQQMQQHVVLAIHPRHEFLATLSAGLLAFDGQGRVSAFNGCAAHLLAGLSLARGTAFDQLFGDDFDRCVARLARHGDVRLRDALGSMLSARLVQAPQAEATREAVRREAGLIVEPGPGSGSEPVRAARPPRSRDATAMHATAPGFVAEDPALREAMRVVESAVKLGAPVLLHGETGTGKELMARHAHAASGRRGEFVAVNCGAFPAELFEAELFGYVGGAFTGARREGHPGLIASADGGTLLLDEIAELPPRLQAALLRFLDDRQVRPVGGTTARPVDVQLLAASHADLDEEVAARRFRADLLFRLNTVRVDLPPLRRRSDFTALVEHTLATLSPTARLDRDAMRVLAGQRWPGNLRELRAVLTRALVHAGDGALTVSDVARVLPGTPHPQEDEYAPPSALRRSAREQVMQEFDRTGGCVSQTSRNLGVSRTTVYRYLRGTTARR